MVATKILSTVKQNPETSIPKEERLRSAIHWCQTIQGILWTHKSVEVQMLMLDWFKYATIFQICEGGGSKFHIVPGIPWRCRVVARNCIDFQIYRLDFGLVIASRSLNIQRSSIPVDCKWVLHTEFEWKKQNKLLHEEF